MSLNKYDPRARILPSRVTLRQKLSPAVLGDTNATITTDQLKGYALQITPTSDRTLALPPASQVVDSCVKIGMSEGIDFLVQHNGTTATVTLTVGTGGTMSGSAVTGAGEARRYFLRIDNGMTGSEAYTVYDLGGGPAASTALTAASGQMEMNWTDEGTTYVPLAGSTLGDAGTWTALVAGQGVQVPGLANSSPALLNNMEIWFTGTTVPALGMQVNINALRLDSNLTNPVDYYGIYRYEIGLTLNMPDWNQEDAGHLYRAMLARNGTPLTDAYGTQGNNSLYTNAAIYPYSQSWTSFPLDAPHCISVAGLTYINSATDYFTVFLQDFRNGGTTNVINVSTCTLSMNRVAPLNASLAPV